MAITKTINDVENGGVYDTISVPGIVYDTKPVEGSFNGVTSDAVVKAIDKAKDDMQEKIDEVTLDPSAVALGNVHLLDEVTEFHADGCILVDSETNGPGEMSKDTLLELTAQNALAGNVAHEFVPNSTTTIARMPYVYNGLLYLAKVVYQGPWDSTKFTRIDLETYIEISKQYKSVSAGSYFGYFKTNDGPGITLSYRDAASGEVAGLVVVCRSGGSVKATHVNGFSTECPFEFYYDGKNCAVKNKLPRAIAVNLVVGSDNFVVSSSLPSDWQSGSATKIGDYVNISDQSSFVNSSFVNNAVANAKRYQSVNANAWIGYYPDPNGPGIVISYRDAASGLTSGLALITRSGGTVKVTHVNGFADECPFEVYWDGTRAAVKNVLGRALNICFVVSDVNFVVSDTLPASWQSGSATKIGDYVNITAIPPSVTKSSYTENVGQTQYLTAISRYRKAGTSKQDFCFMIVTDSHDDWQSVKNAMDCVNGFAPLKMLVHCGDTTDTIQRGTSSLNSWNNVVSSATKPVLFVNGNHDAGNYRSIRYTPSKAELYAIFIAPLVEKGFLVEGAYTENKMYYYKDFSDEKTRFIVIDEYEAPEDVNETYWEKVTYNSSYPMCENNTDYDEGDLVNVQGYTDYSFRAKQNLNSGAYYSGYQPCFKIIKGYRCISQDQAEWLVDALDSVPDGYSVVIAMHQAIVNNAEKITSKFTQTDFDAQIEIASVMATELVSKILNNYKNKTAESISVSFSGDGAYLTGYTVSADFTSNVKTLKNIICIGGHYHRDIIVKDENDTYQVLATTSNTTSQPNYTSSDIERKQTSVSDFVACDSLTCVAIRDDGDTGLCKIGNNVTYGGTFRDIEVIESL